MALKKVVKQRLVVDIIRRDDDEDVGTLYGYNASSVASLNNKMTDDVKVILAQYRLALKVNNARRQN